MFCYFEIFIAVAFFLMQKIAADVIFHGKDGDGNIKINAISDVTEAFVVEISENKIPDAVPVHQITIDGLKNTSQFVRECPFQRTNSMFDLTVLKNSSIFSVEA